MRGRAIILRTPTLISPFGDPASAAMFSGETIAQTQERAFARLGLEILRPDTTREAARAIREAAESDIVVLLMDRVYVSEKAAHDFIKAARSTPRPVALCLSQNASVAYTLPLSSVVRQADLVVHDVLLVSPATVAEEHEDPILWLRNIAKGATQVVVPKREIVVPITLPVIGEGTKTVLDYPVTSTVVVSIEHWVHILWLNQIAFGIRWMELLRRRPVWGLWRALTAFSINKDRILDQLVHQGRACEIHPTAHLSASILGNNVRVGPHATIRNSMVGDGAIVADHAVLINSVVGPGAFILDNTFLVSSVIYPDATVGNYKLQVSLVGRGAYLNVWASLVDAKFSGDVKVLHQGSYQSTGRAFLGSVVGHRAKLAAKILIQPGREIPNDAVIVMRPDEVIAHIPANLPKGTPLVRHRGTLVPLGQETVEP